MDFGFWILDFGFWILDFGFWILDFGSWILDFGFWILDFGFWSLDFGFWILDQFSIRSFCGGPKRRRLDFGFWSLDFGFWILDFGLDEALLDIVWILHKIFPCHADSGRRIFISQLSHSLHFPHFKKPRQISHWIVMGSFSFTALWNLWRADTQGNVCFWRAILKESLCNTNLSSSDECCSEWYFGRCEHCGFQRPYLLRGLRRNASSATEAT